LTFAKAVEQIWVGDCGRSPVSTEDGDKFAAERLHAKVANWRCRPSAAVGVNKSERAKQAYEIDSLAIWDGLAASVDLNAKRCVVRQRSPVTDATPIHGAHSTFRRAQCEQRAQ